MRPTRLLTAALVAVTLVSSPCAAAADIFVSPFIGLKFKGDTNELDLENGAGETKPTLGFSGVVVSDKGFGVELEFGYSSRFFERADRALVTRSGVTTVTGNVLLAAPLSITRESLRPYVVGGLGWMHASANDILAFGPVSNDFLGLTLGAGAVGFIGDVTGLRFDLRYLKSLTSSDTSNVSGDRARLSFWRATVGVVFR